MIGEFHFLFLHCRATHSLNKTWWNKMHVGTAVHVPPQRVGKMFPHKSILIQRRSFVGANLGRRPPAKMKFLAYPGAWGCGRDRPPVAFLPLASRVEQPNISQHDRKLPSVFLYLCQPPSSDFPFLIPTEVLTLALFVSSDFLQIYNLGKILAMS
jgi:hypothetical protein